MKKLVLLLLFLCTPVWADAPTRSYDFIPATTIRSDEIDTEFNNLFGYLQTGVDSIRTDGLNAITEIHSLLRTGDETQLVTGESGSANTIAYWDSNGDLQGRDQWYDDIRINPGSFDRPGISDPDIVAYDVNGGGTSTYLWEFAKNDVASFTVQMPHSYKTGEDIKVHIHWTPGSRGNEENGATVGWKVQCSWANINGSFPTMSTYDLSDACDGTDHKHQMTPDTTITGTSKGISSMLLCNVRRTDTGTDDTWASGTTGQLPLLTEIDIHYPIDTPGSSDWSSK